MKVTRSQLRQIIKEAIDVMNLETGEIKVFGDDEYSDLPSAAWPDLVKRLSLNPQDDGEAIRPGNQNYGLSDEDFEKLSMEIDGKPADREVKRRIDKMKADEARLNVDHLLDRLSDWAKMAADDYMADNQEFPDTHLQDIAWDLASGAKYEFAQDEWDELVWHFDGNEDHVIEYAAESMG
jgi:hypothetical protein